MKKPIFSKKFTSSLHRSEKKESEERKKLGKREENNVPKRLISEKCDSPER